MPLYIAQSGDLKRCYRCLTHSQLCCCFFPEDLLEYLSYLGIKWISLELIHTLEIMSVALRHHQTVFISFEQVRFVKHLIPSSSEVPLPLHIDKSAPFSEPTKSGCFLLVSVEIDNQGKPECVDLILRKSVEIRFRLQVVVGCSVLLPIKVDLEL